jgi:hypothetical protein
METPASPTPPRPSPLSVFALPPSGGVSANAIIYPSNSRGTATGQRKLAASATAAIATAASALAQLGPVAAAAAEKLLLRDNDSGDGGGAGIGRSGTKPPKPTQRTDTSPPSSDINHMCLIQTNHNKTIST